MGGLIKFTQSTIHRAIGRVGLVCVGCSRGVVQSLCRYDHSLPMQCR